MNALTIIDHIPALPEVLLLMGACAVMLGWTGVSLSLRRFAAWRRRRARVFVA